jgi:hypothetical protein
MSVLGISASEQEIPPSPSKLGRYLNMYGPLDSRLLSRGLNPPPCVIPVPSMPTAILMAYTREGFVGISDGKGTNGKTDSQDEQKMFGVAGPNLKLMYGVSGAASILDLDGITEVLQPVYRSIIERLARRSVPDLGSYADDVILQIRPELSKEIKKERPLPDSTVSPSDPVIFKIQFAGYCDDKPVITERELCLWADKWCVTTSNPLCTIYPGRYSYVGSPKILQKLVDPYDDLFQQFKTIGSNKLIKMDGSISRDEFIDGATKYIQACMTQEARDIDSYCKTIGGNIWKATLGANGDFDVRVLVPFNGSV